MSQSVKRTLVILSFAFNLGFALAIVVAFVHESNEQRQQQDLLSQHYEFYHKLNLTAQQDSTIDSLLAAYLERQRTLRSNAFRLERELKDVALSTDPDSMQTNTLMSEIASIHTEQEKLTLQHLRHVRAVLTPPQIHQMDAMLEDYFRQREHGH